MPKKGETNNPGGRPKKDPADKYETKARKFGRVGEEEWQELHVAAKSAKKTFTQWALEILLRAARRKR